MGIVFVLFGVLLNTCIKILPGLEEILLILKSKDNINENDEKELLALHLLKQNI